LRIFFNGVKDVDGRQLNVKSFITINQFREFFVQRTNISDVNTENAVYLNPGIPLVIQKPEVNDTLDYWMNTPLKRKTPTVTSNHEPVTQQQ